ncbi:sugar kinase [Streptomyces spinoverrucosus]|uniref:sugar kinase n=1 Tax=Streptomyces spinoverrucosus TaxID=284043 RepID=UPI0018C37363|nr:sugar kinase [Streptomyces spinoverrucosus]MBG0851825.1 sugar kinase [Streptomyces spinoverrucosus]
MTTPSAPAIAVDAGTRFLRVAWTRADGTPELVQLPGTVPGEGLPTPVGVRGDREAALNVAYAAYREHCGAPGPVVLVVPPEERAVLPGDGPLPRPRLLSTPHAVLALLRHAESRTASRWLVCDLGASAAEVAECAVAAGAVAVPRVARYAPADDGYGAAFDAAVLAGAGLPVDDPEKLLELARAMDNNGRRLDVALDRMAARPDRADRFADTVVFEVAGREITAGLVHRALDLLKGGLDGALDGLPGVRGAADDPDTRVVAVGGPARSGALLRHLTGRLGPPTPLPGGTDPALAAVFGAALVAGGHIDPPDRCPHAVAVGVHRTVAGRPRDEELLISPPRTLEPGGATVFAETGGERVRIRTGPAHGTGGREVRILVHAAGTDAAAPVGVVTVPQYGDGAYVNVGVRVATDGTACLVLQPLGRTAPGGHPAQDHQPAEPPPEEFPFGLLPTDPQPDTQGDRT